MVATHIFDTLVERDQNLKIVPALASELPKLVAPTVWEVKLRLGVKFHNGEEFTAESVKFSLERVKSGLRASSDFDGMVDQAQTQMDEKQRLAIYHRINKLWIDDMPAVPLYQQLDLYGANKRLNWKARSDELIKAYDMSIK